MKSFFGALVEDSNSRTFKEKLRDVKAKKDAQKIVDYDKDIQKEIDKPSTEFQVGAALGMAINNFSTTVRIGDARTPRRSRPRAAPCRSRRAATTTPNSR